MDRSRGVGWGTGAPDPLPPPPWKITSCYTFPKRSWYGPSGSNCLSRDPYWLQLLLEGSVLGPMASRGGSVQPFVKNVGDKKTTFS